MVRVTGHSWDLSLERPPLGAGGRPQAEIHRPPPLPWASRGRDHRHRARTGPTQIDGNVVQSLEYIWHHLPKTYRKYKALGFYSNKSCLSMLCF